MPDVIRKIDYFSIDFTNKVGEGARILSALRDGGVDLEGVWGYVVSARKARLEVLPKDSAGFGKIAKKAGVEAGKKQTAFLVEGEDRPGAVADLLAKLSAAKVNVLAVKATCAGEGRYGGVIMVDSTDVKKAAKALSA